MFGSYGRLTPNTVISRNDWEGKTYWFLPVRLLPDTNQLQSFENPSVDLLEGLILEEVDLAKQLFRRYGYYSGCDAYPDNTFYHNFKKERLKKPARPWPLPSQMALSSTNSQPEWPEAEARTVASELFHGCYQRTINLI